MSVTPISPFKKLATIFSHRYEVMTFLAIISYNSHLPTSSHISVLCLFSHNFFPVEGVTPRMVSPVVVRFPRP